MGFKLDESAGKFAEGLHLVEVEECFQKHSQRSGDGYFAVKMRDVHTDESFFENWMCEGKGQGMTIPKMRALGLDIGSIIEAQDLVGHRMIVRIKHKESDEFGTQAQIAKAWPESNPPPDWKKPDEPPPSEGTIPLSEGPLAPF